MPAKAILLEVPGPAGLRSMRITSPDRVIWPDAGITKLDLARYAAALAKPLLRALGERPVTLQRFPGNRGRSVLFQEPPRGFPTLCAPSR